MPQSVTLGGLDIIAEDEVIWSQTAGVSPSWQSFLCEPAVADALLAGRGPHTLVITKDDGERQEWTNLWALVKEAGPDPHMDRLRVYDRRWFWRYGHILRRFNMRRKAGFFRISANDVPELERVEPLYQFATYSVRSYEGTIVRWSARQVVEDVVQNAAEIEASLGGQGAGGGLVGGVAPVKFELSGGADVPDIPIIDLEIDERADTAVTRVLNYMPELSITVDPDGTIVVFDRTRGDEFELTPKDDPNDSPGPEVVGGGHSVVIDHANEAPAEIHFLFTVEAEVRLDYDAEDERNNDPDESARKIYNVLPVPDYSFQAGTFTAAQGTFLDMQDYISLLPETPFGGSLNDEMIREGMLPFSDIFPSIIEVGSLTVDDDWAARAEGIHAHFYQTFRVARDWHDRVKEWRLYRTATVNQATGTRAPANAWGGYFRLGSDRSQFRDYSQTNAPGEMHYGFNVDGYRSTLDSEARPLPALVTNYDLEQGVFRLSFQPDPLRVYTQFLPAQISSLKIPAFHRPGEQSTTPISFDSLKQPGDSLPQLVSDHKLSVVLTAVPAAPNDQRQLYRVIVRPSDLPATVPPLVREAASGARGPVQQVRVPPSVEVARIRWLDGRSDEIENLFGVGEKVAPDVRNVRDALLGDLCVNANGSNATPINNWPGGAHIGAPLDEIATAMASRIWASYVKHPQGQSTYDMQSDRLKLRGWVSGVDHMVMPDGSTFTSVRFPDRLQELDWVALLPREVQAQLLREVV